MGKNRIVKTLTGSGTFTVPAGVTQISVYSRFGDEKLSPVNVGFLSTVAHTQTGQAYSWGDNRDGQLGDGTIIDKSSPVAVVGGYSFVSVTGGGSAGTGFTIGLTASGQAYGWGLNTSGRLGDGTTVTKSSPVAVVGGYSFNQISSGVSHTLALTDSGQAYGWGANTNGVIGDGTIVSRSSPVPVVGGYSFIQVSCSSSSFGLTASGQAYAWGNNGTGQLGDDTLVSKSSPVAVVGGYSFIQISAGGSHTLGLTASGQAYAWGANTSGQLGDDTLVSKSSPVAVVGGYSFIQVSAGGSNSFGLTASGQLYGWGFNSSGQIGDGTVIRRSSPVAVVGGYSFIQVSAGSGGTNSAISVEGRIYSWGQNVNGIIGDGTIVPKSSPVAVVGNLFFSVIPPLTLRCSITVRPGDSIGYKTGLARTYFGQAVFNTDISEFVVEYFA